MSLNYRTELPYQQPVSDTQPAGITPVSPYGKKYGRNHQDVLNYVGSINADAYRRAAENVNDEYASRYRSTQQGLALAGLQQMAQSQQNQADLANSRLQQMTGFASGLLGGLFD